MPTAMHPDELAIDEDLVRLLVARDHPQLIGPRLSRLEVSGSSNALFRLGDDLLVRLPRQPGGGAVIDKEVQWLPVIAAHFPVAVPEVVAIAEPGFGYPERWSIVRWIEGSVPTVPVDDTSGGLPRLALAHDLAVVVRALRGIDVPRGTAATSLIWYRGGPLAARDAATMAAIEACGDLGGMDLDLDAVTAVWRDALRLPDAGGAPAPRWYHGDLLAENLLVNGRRLAAVVDFGGLAIGDPTIDLMVAWQVLDAGARDVFFEAVEADLLSRMRARAWALSIALVCLPYYWESMPARCASQRQVIRTVVAEAQSHC